METPLCPDNPREMCGTSDSWHRSCLHVRSSGLSALGPSRTGRDEQVRPVARASMPRVGAEGWDHLDDCPQQDDVHTKLTIGRNGLLATAFHVWPQSESCSWCPGSGVDRRLLARV